MNDGLKSADRQVQTSGRFASCSEVFHLASIPSPRRRPSCTVLPLSHQWVVGRFLECTARHTGETPLSLRGERLLMLTCEQSPKKDDENEMAPGRTFSRARARRFSLRSSHSKRLVHTCEIGEEGEAADHRREFGAWRDVSPVARAGDDVRCGFGSRVTARSRVSHFTVVRASSCQCAAVQDPQFSGRRRARTLAYSSAIRGNLAQCSDNVISRLPRLGSRVRIPSPAPVSKSFKAAEFRGFFVFRAVEIAAARMPLSGRGLPAGYKLGETTKREIAASAECEAIHHDRPELTEVVSERPLQTDQTWTCERDAILTTFLVVHSGSPAFLKPSFSLSRSSVRRRG